MEKDLCRINYPLDTNGKLCILNASTDRSRCYIESGVVHATAIKDYTEADKVFVNLNSAQIEIYEKAIESVKNNANN